MLQKWIKKKIVSLGIIVVAITLLQTSIVVAKNLKEVRETFIILATANVNGKCWDENLIEHTKQENNLLQISSAIKDFRNQYNNRVILLDQGNTFGGTAVSTYPFQMELDQFEGELPMAMGLKYLQYDAFFPGICEFDYPWESMKKVYGYLESNKIDLDGDKKAEAGVPIVSGNMVYKATQGSRKKNQPIFHPWIEKEIKIGKETLKVGILGVENIEASRAIISDYASNINFFHLNNKNKDMTLEIERYLSKMKKAGCDFIILSYQSGSDYRLNSLEEEEGRKNSLLYLIKNTSGIDLIITGDCYADMPADHRYLNKDNKSVLVVDAASAPMTKVEVVVEKKNKNFDISMVADEPGVDLSKYKSDLALKKLMRPYAEKAKRYLDSVCSDNFYWGQRSVTDFVNRAQMVMGTKYMRKKFNPSNVTLETLQKTYGNTYTLEVDCSVCSADVSEKRIVEKGSIFMKNLYEYYRPDSSLYILPLTGAQMKEVLEEVMSKNSKGISESTPVFYGVDFEVDWSKEEGGRVTIQGFQDGKVFSLQQTYNVAIDSKQLRNGVFSKYGVEQTIWSQLEDLNHYGTREVIKDYVIEVSSRY